MLPGKVYTPEAVLEVVWRHKWLVALPFVLVTAGVSAYAQWLPNLYRSETLIMVVPQRVPDTYVRSTVTSRIEDRLRSISEQILSRSRLEQVIKEFDLYVQQRSRLPMERVVEIMRRDIKVEPVRGDMFRVSFVSENPAVPANVVTRLADMFIEENQRDRTVLAENTSEFLESQLVEAKARLVEHERKLERYRLAHGGELPSQFESNLQMIQATQAQLQALLESMDRDRDRLMELEAALAAVKRDEPSSILKGDSAATSQPDPLETARAELRELQTRLTANHPDVVAKRRQVEELESVLAANPVITTAPAAEGEQVKFRSRIDRERQIEVEIERIKTQLRSKEQNESQLNGTITEYHRRVEAVPTRETEMTELMRDYDTLQRTYTSLLTKKQDSILSANLERRQIGEQFKVLDPARTAERPFSPNRLRIDLLGAVAGLLLGLSLAGLVEYRDTAFRTEEDVLRVLLLPVLAVIPVIESPREQRARRLRIALTSLAGVVAVAVTVTILALSSDLMEWLR